MGDRSPITEAQKKGIWARGRQLGLEREEIYDLVAHYTGGSRSVSNMTKREAMRLLDYLFGRKPEAKPYPAPGHVRKILELKHELGWSNAKFTGWLRKYFKVDAVEWLTKEKARGAFVALMSIKKRGKQ